jgi:DNA-binding NarL/FixJ family response regulator
MVQHVGMVDHVTRTQVRALLDAIRERPTELPMTELVELTGRPVRITVGRTAGDPVVFVPPRLDPRFENLSPREFEVATLVAAEFSNRQIANTICISIATVKDQVHAILQTTELTSLAEVAAAWYGRLRCHFSRAGSPCQLPAPRQGADRL